MSNIEAIRIDFPSGRCAMPYAAVDGTLQGEDYELFNALDNGNAEPALIKDAVQSCQECHQVGSCGANVVTLKDVLWAKGGKNLVVGAARIARSESPKQIVDLGLPVLKFDLSIMPVEPDRRLRYIRQGVRAEQLTIVSRVPDNAAVIAENYKGLLADGYPEALEHFQTTLEDDEQESALTYIVMTLCQQADYENFSQQVKSSTKGAENKRFDPESHDYDTNLETVALYLEEACAIKEMGFSNPGRIAINQSSEYIDKLLAKFGGITRPSIIRQVIVSSTRDPGTALTAFSVRLQRLRDSSVFSDAAASRLALSNDVDAVIAAAVERDAAAKSPKRSPRSSQTQRAAKPRSGQAAEILDPSTLVGQRAAELTVEFGEHEDVTPGIINNFAKGFPTRYMDVMLKYLARVELWRGWSRLPENAGYDYVPESFLRQHAMRTDVDSFEDIVRAHKVKTLMQKFKGRNGRVEGGLKVRFEPWLMNRIAELYPIEQIESVANDVFDLLKFNYLNYANADLGEFQDPSVYVDIDGISDPESRLQLMFSEALCSMTSAQRIMLAHHYNLGNLIYGRGFSDEQVANYVSASNEENLDWQALIDTGLEYIDELGSGGVVPYSTIRKDLIGLVLANPESFDYQPVAADRSTRRVSVIGCHVVNMALSHRDFQAFDIDNLPVNQMAWIEDVIDTAYPPSEKNAGAMGFLAAVANGNLVIEGDSAADFRITLSSQFYADNISDRHRAAAARIMNIDRPLYEESLEPQFRNLFNSNIGIVRFVTNEVIERLTGWESEGWMRDRINSTAAAVGMVAARYFERNKRWLYGTKVIGFNASEAQAITSNKFVDAPRQGWTPHSELKSRYPTVTGGLASIIKKAGVSGESKHLARNGDYLLDVYYSRSAVEAIDGVVAQAA